MNDKQTAALLVLLMVAFVFWLYNSKSNDGTTSKLKSVVDEIRGITASTSTGPAPVLSAVPVPSKTHPGVWVIPGSYNYLPQNGQQSAFASGMEYGNGTNAYLVSDGTAYYPIAPSGGYTNTGVSDTLYNAGYV